MKTLDLKPTTDSRLLVIMGKYKRERAEEIDTVDPVDFSDHRSARKELNRLADEYRMAFGQGWKIWTKSRKRKADD